MGNDTTLDVSINLSSAGAIAGYVADRQGAEWTLAACLLLSLPWCLVLILKKHLALFIFAFAASSKRGSPS